MSESLIG